MVELTDEQAGEIRSFISDIEASPYAGGEIHAMGGVRAVLSDETLRAVGFKIDTPPSKRAEAMRLLNAKKKTE